MTPRILHLRNARGITTLTGPETYLLDLLPGLAAAGFDAHLLCQVRRDDPAHPFLATLRERGVSFEALVPRSRWDPGDVGQTARALRARGAAVLHTHDARSDVVGGVAARRAGAKWITFAHGWVNWTRPGTKEWLYARLEARAVARSDRVVVASADMRRDLLGRGVPAARITRIPYGIDTGRFRPLPDEGRRVRAELGVAPDALVFGTVGRFHPWKGHRHLVEAAARVVRERPEARFVLAGDAVFGAQRGFREELAARIRGAGLESRFVLAGTRTDMPAVMNAFDVVVQPSLREPFGIVLIEGAACGRPVVGTRVGGIPETMEEGTGGLLVPPADPEALAAALLELARDPARRAAMGRAGRGFVERRYSKDAMVAATARLYREVAAE